MALMFHGLLRLFLLLFYDCNLALVSLFMTNKTVCCLVGIKAPSSYGLFEVFLICLCVAFAMPCKFSVAILDNKMHNHRPQWLKNITKLRGKTMSHLGNRLLKFLIALTLWFYTVAVVLTLAGTCCDGLAGLACQ